MLAQVAQRGICLTLCNLSIEMGARGGMGSTCCRKETGKTIAQLLKELDEQEAAAAAEQQEPDTQA